MFKYFYNRPYFLYSLIAAFFIMGVVGLIKLPKNLFPDSNPPQVIVITQVPGATAQVAASTVSKPIEQEIARLGLITDVSSTNVANFSIVKAEFGYDKGLNEAAVDVANALSIAKSNLPQNVNPAIYTAGDFTLPVDVISISPKDESMNLGDLRKFADDFMKPYLLSNLDIGNVEVFGGYQSAINIEIDPFKAKKYGVDFDKLTQALKTLNKDIPIGFVKSESRFFTITYYGERNEIENIKNITFMPNLRIGDVADVNWGHSKRTSGYIGNGKPSIALAIQRAPKGSVIGVSDAAREEMAKLEQQYPNINFEIADTQRNLIELANANMIEALRDAIIFILLVILLFLGDFKAIIAAAASIPLVFFATIAVIWLMGGELNIVIYTAIILALGMLADDAVVVLENIERHSTELKEELNTAVIKGTQEVILPNLAGTATTILVVFPLMFVGGFPQKIFQPLIMTLIIAMLISFFLSITLIPLIIKELLKRGMGKTKVEVWMNRFYDKTIGKLRTPYLNVLAFSNGKRRIWRRIGLSVGVLILLLVSLRTVMPTIGRDAMPPMDTGIIKAQIAFSANETVDSAEKKMKPFLEWLHDQDWVNKSSVAFGSEAGVLSMGSGNIPAEASITINCVDRFSREQSLWTLEDTIRNRIAKIEGVKRNDVFDFGATALSSVKAPVDVRLKSPVVEGLSEKSKNVENALMDIKGLTSVSTTWNKDFSEIELDIDENKALSYGITPMQIAMQIPVKGQQVGLVSNLQSMNTQVVKLHLKGKYSENEQTLRLLPIQTDLGEVPLEHLATISKRFTYAKIERNQMMYSIDINGYRAKRPISHLTDDAEAALINFKEDNGDVIVSQEGDIATIDDSFQRMMTAIGLGILLLALGLVAIYKSVRKSIIMILVLPLSLIGASWGMLIFDKPSCMPSMLGILLLFGIIIKNAVLLMDFYQQHRESGETPYESAIESVKIRFRPVMMTAFATIAGMIPIAAEQAVGLERLSPLADVAIGGLFIGTLLTLIFVPMYAYIFEPKRSKIKGH